MKTITAKEFQLNLSKHLKRVAAGERLQVTFHGKPWVELGPGNHEVATAPPGSHAAFLESLKYTLPANDLPDAPDWKALRAEAMKKKYDME